MLASLPAPLLAQSRFGGTAALSSQLVDRGLAITPETPVMQGSLSWTSPRGWSAGVAAGVEARSPGRPVIAVARASRAWVPAADWTVQANFLHYHYGGQGSRMPDRSEAGASLAWRDTVMIGLSAIRVSGHPGQRWLGAADAGASWPLTERLSLTAGAGVAQTVVRGYRAYGHGYGYGQYAYTYLRRYGYGNAGLAWSGGPWRLQVDRYRNSLGGQRAYGAADAPDWVATLSWSF